jgi:hypothetical protein
MFTPSRLKFYLALVAFALINTTLLPNPGFAQNNEVLVNRSVIELPPYEEIKDRRLINLYTPQQDYIKARADDNFIFEKLTYLNDGLKVITHLYRPKG